MPIPKRVYKMTPIGDTLAAFCVKAVSKQINFRDPYRLKDLNDAWLPLELLLLFANSVDSGEPALMPEPSLKLSERNLARRMHM